MCVCVCVLQEKADLGELNFSLCYLPTAGRLTVTIIKATNLKAMDLTGFSGKGGSLSLTHANKRGRKTAVSSFLVGLSTLILLDFSFKPWLVAVAMAMSPERFTCDGTQLRPARLRLWTRAGWLMGLFVETPRL